MPMDFSSLLEGDQRRKLKAPYFVARFHFGNNGRYTLCRTRDARSHAMGGRSTAASVLRIGVKRQRIRVKSLPPMMSARSLPTI